MKSSTHLSLIVPVYNEAASIDLFVDRVNEVFSEVPSITFEFVFVNDGSTDETLERLLSRQKEYRGIRIVDLSRNFGKEAALTAGLDAAEGDVVVPLDVDLQDPPELIMEMLAKWEEGYEVVLGRRTNRDSDSWMKRESAALFYRVHNMIAHLKIPENVGDFRLMDRQVVEALKTLPETQRFMKGIFAWAGFRTTYVDYTRPERATGATSFSGWKLWNFALEGITGFSTVPLRIWSYIGFIVAFIAFVYAIWTAVEVLAFGVEVPGYASTIVSVFFFGGLNLMGIGIIGEYLGRAYVESKRRPPYLVRRVYSVDEERSS